MLYISNRGIDKLEMESIFIRVILQLGREWFNSRLRLNILFACSLDVTAAMIITGASFPRKQEECFYSASLHFISRRFCPPLEILSRVYWFTCLILSL